MKQVCRILGVLWIFLCLSVLHLQNVEAGTMDHRPVKVGYYPVANYQEINEDGTYNGFSYDYYMQMQKYARWEYEFVEASYAECLQMLQSGEIDVMSGIVRTEEREKQMIFSNYSVSSSQNKLYARNDSTQIFYESYDAFEGCKIAMMQGMLTDEIEKFAEKHKFSMQLVQYDTMSKMEEALLSGEVDLVCASSITNSIDTKIVARMDKQPLYFATSRKSPEIAEELDEALHKIVDNNPDFYTQLSEKYMINGANATATFTREEMQYIQSGQPIALIVNANWAPITWYDEKTKSYRGIFIDVINEIQEYSGLQFKLYTEEEFNEEAKSNPQMIENVLAILADDNSWAVQQNVMMSNHVVDSSVVMVSKRGVLGTEKEKKDLRIALPKRFYIGYVMREELKKHEVVYYDTVEDCLDAVNSGKADATYVNQLVATYYLSMLEYSGLFATANSGYYENLAFAVNKDADNPLLSILDKSLLCLGTKEMGQIVIQNSVAEERVSFKGLYYTNPALMLAAVVLILTLVFLVLSFIYYSVMKKRRMEETLQKELETGNARTEFFMMISHELRTPLNAIVGYLELAEEQCRKEGREIEYLKRSQSAARQLTHISEDMLDYTRITSESIEMREELFDLKEIVMSVDGNISMRAAKKELDYQFAVQDITHEYVIGDRLRIEQVMQNLLSNSVKFTNPGGHVHAELFERVLQDHTVEMTFICRDTGKGMPEDFLKKVCAPFNQSDKSYSRTHGGLGLGLFLTKYFVDAMHGSFSVESTLGEGSCFTVTLPLRRPNSEQILEHQVDCSHVRAIVGGKNPLENQQMRDLLKRLNMKSDLVEDSKKLLRRIQSREGGKYAYSLCILDETLLESEETLPEVIAEQSESLQIFVMTNDSSKTNGWPGCSRVREVLYKPIFQSVLFDAVMNTFGEYQVEHSEEEIQNLEGLHAMVVEDNAVNADILTRIIQKAGGRVTVCENGKKAVDLFKEESAQEFQIIFMDIQMPVMNGYEAAREICALQKGREHPVPVVAVSANAFPEDIENSLKSGMKEHLSKPVNAVRIFQVIQKYCIGFEENPKVIH